MAFNDEGLFIIGFRKLAPEGGGDRRCDSHSLIDTSPEVGAS